MKNLILISSVALLLTSNAVATNNGKELFANKCAVCHSLTQPTNPSQVIAPPANGLMFHMDEKFKKNKNAIISHIETFSINPTTKKAKLKDAVKRFGLMPSQKSNITKEEIKTVSHWMVENLHMSKKQHDAHKKRDLQ